jgi:hypothetical protein
MGGEELAHEATDPPGAAVDEKHLQPRDEVFNFKLIGRTEAPVAVD